MPAGYLGLGEGELAEAMIEQDTVTLRAPASSPGELVQAMSLPAKLAQLTGISGTSLLDAGGFNPELARKLIPHGVGQISALARSVQCPPEDLAHLHDEIQHFLVEETAAGIPAVFHEEAVAGLSGPGGTQFPQALAQASTWRPELTGRMAAAIREQMRSIGARQALSPVFDLARDPRWGRCEETYGESALLAARFAAAFVRGIQSETLTRGVAATGKHFVAHGLAEGGRNLAGVRIGPRELRRIHALPYAAAIHCAGLASVMNAYHEIDGVPCGASAELLRGFLRDELGFDGVVVSDYTAVRWLMEHHGVAASPEQAAMLAIGAGIDVELPDPDCVPAVEAAVRDGRFPEALVDEAVVRVLTMKQRLGLLDDPYLRDARRPLDPEADRTLAGRIADEAVILLSNDGLLPLSPDLRRLAVIGPAATDADYFFGDYHFHPDGLTKVWAPGEQGRTREPVAVAAASLVDSLAELLDGTELAVDDGHDVSRAQAVAAAADLAVVVVGTTSGFGPERYCGEFHDSATLELPEGQRRLLAAILAGNTPTVVVLAGGRVLAVGDLAERAGALVQAWPLGEEGGPALARVLTGRTEPSGRLPISIPRNVGQLPVVHDLPASSARSHPYDDYVDTPASPAFPFGHGLTYTEFRYDDLVVDHIDETTDLPASVRFTLTNAGDRAGTEVAQLYVRDVTASVARPARQLADYAKVSLGPGESTAVRLTAARCALALVDDRLRHVIERGDFELMVGASAADIRLRTTVRLSGPNRYLTWSELAHDAVGDAGHETGDADG
jgi:beta-glucosidase